MSKLRQTTNDPIVCVCALKTTLLAARASGIVYKYSLPHIAFESKHKLKSRPSQIALNCDCTKASVIDVNGYCTLLELNDLDPKEEEVEFQRKDGWAMQW